FTLVLSVMTSLLFGMLPAFTARKVNCRSFMAERTVATLGSPRLRQALIAGEGALTADVSTALVLTRSPGILSSDSGTHPQGELDKHSEDSAVWVTGGRIWVKP